MNHAGRGAIAGFCAIVPVNVPVSVNVPEIRLVDIANDVIVGAGEDRTKSVWPLRGVILPVKPENFAGNPAWIVPCSVFEREIAHVPAEQTAPLIAGAEPLDVTAPFKPATRP